MSSDSTSAAGADAARSNDDPGSGPRVPAWRRRRPERARRRRARAAVAILAATALVLVFASSGGCSSALRYRPIDGAPGPLPDEELVEGMNPFVLTDLTSRRLVVEVDWQAGNEPSAAALESLRAILVKYGPRGREVVIERSDELPPDSFPDVGQLFRPGARLPDGVVSHRPGRGFELVHVLYLGDCGHAFGFSRGWIVPAAHPSAQETDGDGDEAGAGGTRGRETVIPGVVVCLGAARRAARLTITPEEIERATLIHEFGHVLGLVSNARHAKPGVRHECTNLDCVVTHPTPRAIAANFMKGLLTGRLPDDFCRDCQEDIRRAQATWAARAAADPHYARVLERRRRAEEDFAFAGLARQAGDIPRAIALYRSALATLPHRPERATLALLLGTRGEADEAIRVLDAHPAATAAEPAIFPAVAEATILDALCAAGRYEEAVARAGRGRPPQDLESEMAVRVHPAVAWAYEGVGRTAEAAGLLAPHAPRAGAGEEDVRRGAAALFRKAGDLPRARALVEAGVAEGAAENLDAKRLAWLVERARLERAEGRPDEARATLAEVLRDESVWGRSDGQRALAAALAGDGVQAGLLLAKALEDAAAAGPADPADTYAALVGRRLRVNRVRALARLGDLDGAFAALQDVNVETRVRLRFDPCLDEDLDRLRRDPRAPRALAWCPSRTFAEASVVPEPRPAYGALRVAVPVTVGAASPELDACLSTAGPRDLGPSGRLAVRSGPGPEYPVVDRLDREARFHVCGSSGDPAWVGIVYGTPEQEQVGCGVTSPVPSPRAYDGPCASGWVPAASIEILAG